MPKRAPKRRLTEVEKLKAAGPHFKTPDSPRKAPTKRDPNAPIKRTTKVTKSAGVTKTKKATTGTGKRGRPKKTKDQKTEAEAREFIAADNKKKGIEKTLTDMVNSIPQAKCNSLDLARTRSEGRKN